MTIEAKTSMPRIERFTFLGNSLQVVIENYQPLFSLVDACKILGLDPAHQAAGIDPDWYGSCDILSENGIEKMMFVREPALYALVINCQTSMAAEFYRWIFDRLMPLISQSITPIDLPVCPTRDRISLMQYIEISERCAAIACPENLKRALFNKIIYTIEQDNPQEFARGGENFLSAPIPPHPFGDFAIGHDRTLEIAEKPPDLVGMPK